MKKRLAGVALILAIIFSLSVAVYADASGTRPPYGGPLSTPICETTTS